MIEQPTGGPESLEPSAPPVVADASKHGRRRMRPSTSEATASATGLRDPKVLLLALGGVALVGIGGWAFVLPALTGSSHVSSAAAPVIHHKHALHVATKTPPVKTAAKPVAKPLLLAQDFAGVIGRDPFKALLVALPPPAATTGLGVPTAGTGGTAPSGGGTSTSSSSSGGSTTSTGPTKVVLLSVYRTAAGVPHARIQVNGNVSDVIVGGKFGSFFQLNDIINNYAVIQFGDATQVNLYANEPRYFQN